MGPLVSATSRSIASYGVPRYLADKESETYTLDGTQLSPTAVRRPSRPGCRAPRLRAASRHGLRAHRPPRRQARELLVGSHRQDGRQALVRRRAGLRRTRRLGGRPREIELATDPSQTEPIARSSATRSAILTDANGNGSGGRFPPARCRRQPDPLLLRHGHRRIRGARTVRAGRSCTSARSSTPAGPQVIAPRSLASSNSATPQTGRGPRVRDRLPSATRISPRTRRPARTSSSTPPVASFRRLRDLLRRIDIFHGAPTDTDPSHVFRANRTQYDELVKSYGFNYDVDAAVRQVAADIDRPDGHAPRRASRPTASIISTTCARRTASTTVSQADDRHQQWRPTTSARTSSVRWEPACSVARNRPKATSTCTSVSTRSIPEKMARSVARSRSRPVAARREHRIHRPQRRRASGQGLPPVAQRSCEVSPQHDRPRRHGPVVRVRLRRTTVKNLSGLSSEFNVGVEGGVEAQLGVRDPVRHRRRGHRRRGLLHRRQQRRFADFIAAAKVFFNHLERDASTSLLVPTFSTDSSATSVPVDDGTATVGSGQALADAEAQQRALSPLQDTVRRWIAPFAGTVNIAGDVTLDPQPDPTNATSAVHRRRCDGGDSERRERTVACRTRDAGHVGDAWTTSTL